MILANTFLMDNMNIGKAITRGYSKSKPSWILVMCFLTLRVFEHYSFVSSFNFKCYRVILLLEYYLIFPFLWRPVLCQLRVKSATLRRSRIMRSFKT